MSDDSAGSRPRTPAWWRSRQRRPATRSASFSNRGSWITLAAPGVDIASTTTRRQLRPRSLARRSPHRSSRARPPCCGSPPTVPTPPRFARDSSQPPVLHRRRRGRGCTPARRRARGRAARRSVRADAARLCARRVGRPTRSKWCKGCERLAYVAGVGHRTRPRHPSRRRGLGARRLGRSARLRRRAGRRRLRVVAGVGHRASADRAPVPRAVTCSTAGAVCIPSAVRRRRTALRRGRDGTSHATSSRAPAGAAGCSTATAGCTRSAAHLRSPPRARGPEPMSPAHRARRVRHPRLGARRQRRDAPLRTRRHRIARQPANPLAPQPPARDAFSGTGGTGFFLTGQGSVGRFGTPACVAFPSWPGWDIARAFAPAL